MTDCGGLSELTNPSYMGLYQRSSPGSEDYATPLYNSLPTDPWYSIEVTTPTGTQTITFHAPNAALFSEGTEHLLAIRDQTTGWVVGIYRGGSSYDILTLPNASGCGSTSGTACAISVYDQSAASDFYTSQDYGYTNNPPGGNGLAAWASNGFAPEAAIVQEQELVNAVMNHAFMVNVDCVSDGAAGQPPSYVFPANTYPLLCDSGSGAGPQNVNRPSSGTLVFLDYTPTQIAGFSLPSWQTTLLTAASTYGFYVSEGARSPYGIVLTGDENQEGSEAWKYANPSVGCSGTNCFNDPFWPWILGQNGLDGTLILSHKGCGSGSSGGGTSPTSTYRCTGAFLANIPRTVTVGSSSVDAEGNSAGSGLGAYPSGHIDTADECIPKGYAGVAGGCF